MSAALRTGARVLIRHPRAHDRDEFVRLWNASWPFLKPWFPEPESERAGSAAQRFTQLMDSYDTSIDQRHFVCRTEDGAIVGMVNLGQIHRGPLQSCYMGYWVGEPFARQGYTTEGVRLTLARAFDDLSLHRVEANVIPQNVPSVALARKIGFREEGYSPRYLQIAGAWRDHLRFALTAEDWAEMRGGAQPK